MDKDICIGGRECEGYRYSLDGDLRQCVSEALCFERGLYVMEKYGWRTCDTKCSDRMFKEISETSKRCINSCDERFVDDTDGYTCVDTCPNELFVLASVYYTGHNVCRTLD